eukprot:m.165463 g.165463  ORF g.165463 m.165463 type:complete len:537 (+) comp38890_c2_seq87:3165-4775(+)
MLLFAALFFSGCLCLLNAAAVPPSLTGSIHVCGHHVHVEKEKERWNESCSNNEFPRPEYYLDQMKNQTCEIWLMDQAFDTAEKKRGGMLYIYDSAALKDSPGKDPIAIINLTQATIDANNKSSELKCTPGKKPHMISAFPYFVNMQLAVISYVGSGHIQVMDVKTRQIIGCTDTKPKGGSTQNHYAEFTPDGKHIIVLDIGGPDGSSGHIHKIKLEKIHSNEPFLRLVHEKVLNLSECVGDLNTTVARPICGGFDRRNDLFYVTMSKGGLIIADVIGHRFKVIKVYNSSVVGGNGCGGSRRYTGDFGMVTNGASTGNRHLGDYIYFHNTTAPCNGEFPDPLELEIPKETEPAPGDVFYDTTPYGNYPLGDTHGTGLCLVKETGEEVLLSTMRLTNEVVFINTTTRKIFNRQSMTNRLFLPNATPDLISLISYGGGVMCVSLRGGVPLSAIGKFVDGHRRTPGMVCLHMSEDCRSFTMNESDLYRTRYSMHPTSDPHALFEACYEKQNPSSDVPDVEPTSLKVEDENGQKLAATSEE